MTYPERTSTELLRSPHSSVDVLREHRGREAVHGVVRLAEHVLVVLELDDDTDGAEDLLAHDAHVRFGVGEDRGLDPVSFVTVALAT